MLDSIDPNRHIRLDFLIMVYLTCTRHSSYQRKHIDVCRRCSDNDACKAFLEYCAREPAVLNQSPPPEHDRTPPPLLDDLLAALIEIRSLVAAPDKKRTKRRDAAERRLPESEKIFSMVKSELEAIRELCTG